MSHSNTPPVRNQAPLTTRSSSLRCVLAAEHQTAEQYSKTGRTKPRKRLPRSNISAELIVDITTAAELIADITTATELIESTTAAELLLLLKKVGSARLRESDIHPISPKTLAPQYQLIDRKKRKGKNVEDYSRDRAA